MTTPSQNTDFSTNLHHGMEPDLIDGGEIRRASTTIHSPIPRTMPKGDYEMRYDDPEVKGSSWHDEQPTASYVYGLQNDDFWTLIRRFNKQIFRVKKINKQPLSHLDMNIAAEEDINEEKLRAHIERLYTSVIIDIFSFYKHIVRLRSWREHQRTMWFFGVYSAFWLADLLFVMLLTFLIVLVVYPPSRERCFPSAPASLTSGHTGAVKRPMAGVLASDSITGAPEQNKGEAVEQEARSFLKSISALLTGIGSGEFAEEAQDDNGLQRMARGLASVGNIEDRQSSDKRQDRTKEPVSRAVYGFETRVVLHNLPDFIDTWERIANALSPTPPFPVHSARLFLAAWLVLFLFMAYFVTGYVIMKAAGFVTGFVIFGKPVIDYVASYLGNKYPHWKKYVDVRNMALKGVPTNVQLAMTLLRKGEKERAPLPPQPESERNLDVEASLNACDLSDLGASPEEIRAAINPSSQDESKRTFKGEDKSSTTSRIANRIKRTTKDSVRIVHGVAKLAEPPFSEQTQNHQQQKNSRSAGPIRFPARYKNKKGYAYITTAAISPAISWMGENGDLELAWTVAVADVIEVRKITGLGWKRKAIVDWALERDVVGGLVLKTDRGGEYWLTTVGLRDEMFNRIISVGQQIWEVW